MIHVKTKVNIVFVGYKPSSVNLARIVGQLSASSRPTVRSASFWHQPLGVGLQYDYQYNPRFAGKSFDDAFFGYLSTAGFVGGHDLYQEFYNEEEHNVLDIGPTERYIDARATEAWLETQAGARLGIDPAQDTVFLVNWFGRPDFQFHTFTHLGYPDPDTGIDAARYVGSLTRAWGGTSGPTWFVDLSAGPVYADSSWDVDDGDYTGDGVIDYRIPPIWEYGNTTGYRPFTDLSGDLGLLIRYVAVDLLFTPSPIFDPAASVPGPRSGKQIAIDIFEGDPSTNGLNDLHADVVRAAHQNLEPYYDISTTVRDYPLGGGNLAALNGAIGQAPPPPCNEIIPGFPEGSLFCFFRDHRAQYFPSTAQDAMIPVAGYTLPSQAAPNALRFQGLTDDDWSTGKPSYIYELDTPAERYPRGIAYTSLTMHEAGHFVGLSHPHDGYDPTTGDYDAFDATTVALMGDESDTVMSYLYGPINFSTFDRENLARWEVGRLLQLADTDAAAILAAGSNVSAAILLGKADSEFTAAVKAMQAASWITGATDAANGYRDMQRADLAAGVVPASVAAAATGREGTPSGSSAASADRPDELPVVLPGGAAALTPLGTSKAPAGIRHAATTVVPAR